MTSRYPYLQATPRGPGQRNRTPHRHLGTRAGRRQRAITVRGRRPGAGTHRDHHAGHTPSCHPRGPTTEEAPIHALFVAPSEANGSRNRLESPRPLDSLSADPHRWVPESPTGMSRHVPPRHSQWIHQYCAHAWVEGTGAPATPAHRRHLGRPAHQRTDAIGDQTTLRAHRQQSGDDQFGQHQTRPNSHQNAKTEGTGSLGYSRSHSQWRRQRYRAISAQQWSAVSHTLIPNGARRTGGNVRFTSSARHGAHVMTRRAAIKGKSEVSTLSGD